MKIQETIAGTMQAIRTSQQLCREQAKLCKVAGLGKHWYMYMRRLQVLKQQMAILVSWQHALLLAKGSTRVPLPERAKPYTYKQLYGVLAQWGFIW